MYDIIQKVIRLKELRNGYTTGASVAAGVKAALKLIVEGEVVDEVELKALDGTMLTIPIKSIKQNGDEIEVEVIKYSGDDPDITNGTAIITKTRKVEGKEIIYKAGKGVGIVTKKGLQIPVGEAAINLGPRKLIKNVIAEYFDDEVGFEITVEVPEGIELAKRTLNPILGIEGGISIIGTTGVVRPMSEEALKKSLAVQIDVAVTNGYKELIFVPGKIGEETAIKLKFSKESIVQTSNFIGYMLEQAVDKKVEKVILLGHLGKLAKVAGGSFQTHNRMSDGRLETLAAYSAVEGLKSLEVKKILESTTTEEAIEIIKANHIEQVFDIIAERASQRAKRYVFGKLNVETILTDMHGEIIGRGKE